MISLKLNMYNLKELCALKDRFEEMNIFIQEYICSGQVGCESCDYRHLCYDTDHAKHYLTKYINERKENGRR